MCLFYAFKSIWFAWTFTRHRQNHLCIFEIAAGFAVPTPVLNPPPKKDIVGLGSATEGTKTNKVIGQSEKMCELKFGSYCLWRQQHREKIKDFIVKRMKDQLFVARAYYPSIAKLPKLEQFSQEIRQNIQDFERILSGSSSDTDLPP
ncbi:hypothetical protein M8C21_013038, partial [Ambrosia artemisiifolia]